MSRNDDRMILTLVGLLICFLLYGSIRLFIAYDKDVRQERNRTEAMIDEEVQKRKERELRAKNHKRLDRLRSRSDEIENRIKRFKTDDIYKSIDTAQHQVFITETNWRELLPKVRESYARYFAEYCALKSHDPKLYVEIMNHNGDIWSIYQSDSFSDWTP